MNRSDPPPISGSRTSPAVGAVGLAMLLVPFLMSNPWFGVNELRWPWEIFVDSFAHILVHVVFLLWIATGLFALIFSLTEAQFVRAVGVSSLAAALLTITSSKIGGFSNDLWNLNNMASLTTLGAGLWMVGKPETRGAGRVLSGVGAGMLVWATVVAFSDAQGTSSHFHDYARDMGRLFTESDPDFASPHYAWYTLLPETMFFVATAIGMLTAAGVTARWLALTGFLIVLIAFLTPALAGTVAAIAEDSSAHQALQRLSSAFVAHGFIVWLLGVVALTDLALALGWRRSEAA